MLRFMKDVFNPQTPDHPDVAYYSFGGAKKLTPSHPLYVCQKILSKAEGKKQTIKIITQIVNTIYIY